MGDWTLTIQGSGIHHNGRNDDIDNVAREVVRFVGNTDHQTITSATLTVGGTENVADVLGHAAEHPEGATVGESGGLLGDAALGASLNRYGAGEFGAPGTGDIVDFVRDNVRFRGTVAGFSSEGFATVFVIGNADSFFVDRGHLAVVRRFDPTPFRG